MEFPICKVCMKNELLCNGCAKEVGKKEISLEEITNFRQLNKILKSQKSLKDVKIKRILGKSSTIRKNFMIIMAREEDVSKLIGKEGSIVKKLVREFDRPIRIIGEPTDINSLVNDILFSVPVMGINILYKPEGKVYRVRISNKHRDKLPVSFGELANISKYLLNAKVDVIFE